MARSDAWQSEGDVPRVLIEEDGPSDSTGTCS
jgi:hypothetical protein